MQETRRSNNERSDATRAVLLSAAHRFFVAKGYAGTSTPEIAAAAGMTRGALYHHFRDKQDLFRAVVAEEARAVAEAIEAATDGLAAEDALVIGGTAYLDAMAQPGRTRLMLIEGPAVLGLAEIDTLDRANAARTLAEGLRATAGAGMSDLPVDALALLLSAAFDRAAVAISAGADRPPIETAMLRLVRGATRP